MASPPLANVTGRRLARSGEAYTLRRATHTAGANSYTAGSQTVAYYSACGRPRHYRPTEIRGGILERDTLLVLDPATCAAIPAAGDRVAQGTHVADAGAQWLQIVNVDIVRHGGAVAAYRLQVRV